MQMEEAVSCEEVAFGYAEKQETLTPKSVAKHIRKISPKQAFFGAEF